MTTIKLSLRAVLICVLMWCVVAGGCATPDDILWQKTRQELEELSPEQRLDFGDWTINQQAKRYVDGMDKDREVFHLDCSKFLEQPGGFTTPEGTAFINRMKKSRPVTVADLISCLNKNEHMTFWYCVDTFFDDDPFYGDLPCKRIMAPGFQDGDLPDFWKDAEPDYEPRVVAEEGLKELLASVRPPPKWLWPILGIGVVVGGVVALPSIVGSLCILSNNPQHWSCPPSADKLPGQTPQPGGGDR